MVHTSFSPTNTHTFLPRTSTEATSPTFTVVFASFFSPFTNCTRTFSTVSGLRPPALMAARSDLRVEWARAMEAE